MIAYHARMENRTEDKPYFLHMRVSKEWMDNLDAWRAAQSYKPSRTEAVKTMVENTIKAANQLATAHE